MVKTSITIVMIYIVIGLYIHWATEPSLEFNFKRYKRNDWIVFLIDVVFWPIELLIFLGVLTYRKLKLQWNKWNS